MSERSVLFLVSDLAPLTSVGRIRTQKMCKFLPKFGWRTSVLTFEPPLGTLTDPALLEEIPPDTTVYRVGCPRPIEAPVRWASRAVRAVRCRRVNRGRASDHTVSAMPAASEGKPANPAWLDRLSQGVDRLKSGLTRRLMIPDEGLPGVAPMTRAAVEITRRNDIDVLVCSVPGFSPWLAAVLAARRTGVPLIVDYRDLWHGDVLRTWIGPLRTRVELMLERWCLSHTNAVVTVSEGKTRFVRSLDPTADRKPFGTICNGFDEDDLAGIAPSRPERDAGRLLLLYTGRLYRHRRIDPLVESLGRLVTRGEVRQDQVRLRLLGLVEEGQRRRIDELVDRYRLGDVVEAGGYVTRRESLGQQLGADAVVLVVDPGHTSEGVLPGKITEYISLGRFVLAIAPPGEARELLKRYGHALWASGDEPERLDAALRSLVRRWMNDPHFGRRPDPKNTIPSRRENAAQLAAVLTRVVRERAAHNGRRTDKRRIGDPCTAKPRFLRAAARSGGRPTSRGLQSARTKVRGSPPIVDLESNPTSDIQNGCRRSLRSEFTDPVTGYGV